MKTFPTVLAVLALAHSTLSLPQTAQIIARQASETLPRLVSYVQTFHNPDGSDISILPFLQDKTRVTHVILAAVHLNADPGDINLNDNPPNDSYYDFLWPPVEMLQQGGIKVMMMLGGAAPGSYPRLAGNETEVGLLTCSTLRGLTPIQFESYYQPLLAIIRNYSIDGLDLDIEEAVDMSVPLRLLQRLNEDMGEDFILTMAPVASDLTPAMVGLSGFSYQELDAAARDPNRPNGYLVNFFNAQFYNGFGDDNNQVWYDVIMANGWSPSRVLIGALDNSADGGSGFTKLSTLQSVCGQLRANYPDFGGIVGWEYFNAGSSDELT